MDDRARRWLERGREHFEANDFDKAARCLTQVVRIRSDLPDVHYMLGVIYAQRGFAAQSRERFEHALALNPAYTDAAIHLALSYNEQGRYDEARQVYRDMIAARKKRSKPSAASVKPSRAGVDPYVCGKLANKHEEMAQLYEQAGLLEEAVRERERALSLCPGFVDIRAALGATYSALGDLASACREYEQVKKENAQLLAPRLHLGRAYFESGRRAAAIREWTQVLEASPDNRFARLYLDLASKTSPPRARR